MNDAIALAELSVQQYQEILEHARELSRDILGNQAIDFSPVMQHIELLQDRAEATDSLLHQRLQEVDDEVSIAARLNRRIELMQELSQLNRLLVDHLESKMSVMAKELGQSRLSRFAMAGYRNSKHTSKGCNHNCTS